MISSSKISEEIVLHPSDHKKRSDWNNIFEFLERSTKGTRYNKVLDLGGGTGSLAYYFTKNDKNCRSTVVDVKNNLLEIAAGLHEGVETLNYDINKPLPFADNSFDIACCLGTLHYLYIKDPIAVMREMGRVSRHFVFLDFFIN